MGTLREVLFCGLLRRWVGRRWAVLVAAVVVVIGASCSAGADAAVPVGPDGGTELAGETISVGVGLTTESRLLAELVAIALEDRGATVDRVDEVGRDVQRELLGDGEIDLYWDRARTAWAADVERDPSAVVPASVLEDLALADRALNGFRWLDAAGYAGGIGFAAGSTAGAEGVESLRDVGALSLPFCVDPGFVNDPAGLSRMEAALGPIAAARLIEVDLGQIPVEIEAGTCIGQVDRTDPRLATSDTLTLLDDADVLGPEIPVPVVRVEEGTERSTLVDVTNRVAPTLTLTIMQQLVGQVERDGLSPQQVAEGFLVARALIDRPADG